MMASGNMLFGSLTIFVIVSALPLIAVAATAFTKIAVVLLIIRNALGIQQTPPNILIFAIAMVLSGFVMVPVVTASYAALSMPSMNFDSPEGILAAVKVGAEPFRAFMLRLADPEMRIFFVDVARQTWTGELSASVTADDFAIVVPAFMAAELTRAFEIGFLLYLPFLVIDFAVSAILIGLGMQMMSPPVIATPLKLLLFVVIEGWMRLFEGLVLSYSGVAGP